jgi:hypothetical protein
MTRNLTKTTNNKVREKELVAYLEECGIPVEKVSDEVYKLGSMWDAEIACGNCVPEFLYTARKSNEELLCAKRDRKRWVVVMDLDWFLKSFVVGSD